MVSKQKILIVDDDQNIAELISLYLTKECFETQIEQDGESALSAFESLQPNLILLDLMLPGIDGYDVCKEIKRDNEMKNTSIIMVSATFNIKHIAEKYNCNFLPKSVAARSLVEYKMLVDELLKR